MSGYAFRSRYLVATQREAGWDARALSSARHRDFEALEEEFDGIPFFRTPWPTAPLDTLQLKVPFWRERVLTAALERRIVQVARTFRPRLIHAHSPMFNGLAALRGARRLDLPAVYEIRAFWEDDAVDKRKISEGGFIYRQVRRIETGVCRAADAVMVICEGLRKDLTDRGLPPEKIHVVKNGVDPERFQPAERDEALRRELGLDDKEVVGFVGSFFHYEGLPLLVEALARLREARPQLRLVLVGGGEDEERVRAAVAEHGLEDRVLLTGRVPHAEVARYYGLMDLLVYPRLSRRITELVTPLKPLEAQAMAIPVAGSDVGGVAELFEDCEAAGLFPSGSAEGLAELLQAFFSRPPQERRAQAERGRQKVLERRRWADQVAGELQVYERLLGGEA